MRQAFLDECRTWLGTPWGDSGARKGHHSNCFGYIVRSLEAIGQTDLSDLAEPFVCHAMPTGRLSLLHAFNKHLPKINVTDAIAGDLLLIAFEGWHSHVAVVSQPGYVIHSSKRNDGVKEVPIDPAWQIRGAYRIFDG